MVTLNFTLVVQLGLFLLFLWGVRLLVIGPIIKMIDDRQHYIGQQESRATVDRDLAQAQELRYADAVKGMHLEAENHFRESRRAALDEQGTVIARQREQADRAVAIARVEAQKSAQNERGAFRQVVPELADAIAERAGVERPAS